MAPSALRPPQRGRVLAVYGAKGGLGASSVARALAIAFAELDAPQHAALAELDARPARPEPPVARPDAPAIPLRGGGQGSSLTQRATGEWAFSRRRSVRDAVATDATAIAALLDELRERFAHTLLDIGHRPTEGSVTALDCADRILLVAQLAVPALRAMQRTLFLFRRLGYDDDKLCIVINRYRPDGPITIVDAATALRHEIYWRLPHDESLVAPPSGAAMRPPSFSDAHALLSSAIGLARQLEGIEG